MSILNEHLLFGKCPALNYYTMSDAEDDYLSDKFLAAAVAVAPSKPITYAERRKQAQREAELKNAQNRKKTKREIEEETRREGLTTSLFEKAIEQEQAGSTNKAMAMMLKVKLISPVRCGLS